MSSADPWLSGLLACPLTEDAEAVRQALHARGLKTRSVPAGRAKGAWTCVTDRGTLAVVVSGKGAAAAREAASFWMPRARWLVLSGAGPGTGTASEGQVVLDGDHDLAVLAAKPPQTPTPTSNAEPSTSTTVQAKVATVADPKPLGEAARTTLSQAGYAAWDAHVDTLRQAAQAMGGVVLVCQGITTNTPDATPDLHNEIPDGATGRPWWRKALGYVHPASRRAQREADRRHTQATRAAARCAVAALLGPA